MIRQISLNNQQWYLNPDPEDKGKNAKKWHEFSWFKENESSFHEVSLPNSWQTIPGLEKYEGICWYFGKIKLELLKDFKTSEQIARLCFDGANYITDIWLNEKYLGSNEGGYLPFDFRLSNGLLRDITTGKNEFIYIAARVDNTRRHDQIPEFSCDWFQWGGLYRDVYITIQGKNRIERCLITPKIDFQKNGRALSAGIEVELLATKNMKIDYQVSGPKETEIVKGPIEPIQKQPHKYKENMEEIKSFISIDNPKLWDPNNPNLYKLALFTDASVKELVFETNFGLRELSTKGSTILLNRKPISFKGASLHEERFPKGREYTKEERIQDLLDMKSLGFNFLRTAHYSHDESLMEAADEVGMLIGEEIPVYWDIDYENPKVQKLAVKMFRKLIWRDFNHPSVAWWSAGNEIPTAKRSCQLFFQMLLRLGKKLDPSRFVVYVTKNYVFDPIRKYTDIILLNGYLGWYYGNEKHWKVAVELTHATAIKKPLVISEFGAGAKLGYGRHEPINEKFSEWKQASVVGHAIKTFNSKPFMSGWLIWIYRDFKSHMRLNEFQEGYNRKGIVDEMGNKKLLAGWMPNLIDKKIKYTKTQTIIGMFLSKFLWLPMALIGIIVDTVSSLFMHSRNEGYYNKKPEGKFQK